MCNNGFRILHFSSSSKRPLEAWFDLYVCCMHWWIQGRGPGGPPPHIFRPNGVPKSREKIFLRPGSPLIWGSWWPWPPLSEGLDPPLVCTSLLRECDVLLVATWNCAYCNLEVGYNEVSQNGDVSGSLQERDPTRVDSRKQPPSVIDHCIFAFWVAANGSFNCRSKFHILKNKRRPALKGANLDANWSLSTNLFLWCQDSNVTL